MTIQTEQIWENFLASPGNAANFAADGSLLFVPTAATASGAQLPAFFRLNGESLQQVLLQEAGFLKQRSFGESFVVEERIVRFVFDSEMQWLLPTVKPNGQRVQLPLIFFATFSNDKISSLRVHWDQATVLRQIGMLSSELSKWPLNLQHPIHAAKVPVLSGHEICSAFVQEPSVVSVEAPLAKVSLSAPVEPVIVRRQSAKDLLSGNAQSETFHPSTRVNVNRTKSHVFDEGPYQEAPHGKLVNPHKNDTHFRLNEDAAPPAAPRGKVYGNASHFTFDDNVKPHLETLHSGKRPGSSYHNQESSQWEKPVTVVKAQETPAGPPISVWESSSNGLGSIQNRPSSRVLKTPGGGSSIQIA